MQQHRLCLLLTGVFLIVHIHFAALLLQTETKYVVVTCCVVCSLHLAIRTPQNKNMKSYMTSPWKIRQI